MSLGSEPPSQNPYSFTHDLGQPPSGNSGTKTQLTIVGCIMMSMGIITLALLLLGLLSNALDGKLFEPPPADMLPSERVGHTIGSVGAPLTMIVFQLLASCGGLCMILRKSYSLAVTGAIVSLVPICGPCLGLSIPFGIWALVLLLRPEVKFAF